MEPNARILHCRESNKGTKQKFFAPQDLPARAYVPLWAVGLVGEKRSHQKLFWIKQNGSLTTTSGSSSAVERRLPKPDVAGSIPVSRSKSEPPARQLQPSTREREPDLQCNTKLYLPALLADEAADIECICTRPTPKPPTAPAINPITISKGMLSRNDFFFEFAILIFSPRPKLKITTS